MKKSCIFRNTSGQNCIFQLSAAIKMCKFWFSVVKCWQFLAISSKIMIINAVCFKIRINFVSQKQNCHIFLQLVIKRVFPIKCTKIFHILNLSYEKCTNFIIKLLEISVFCNKFERKTHMLELCCSEIAYFRNQYESLAFQKEAS